METNYKLIPVDKQYKGVPLVDSTLNINLEETSKHLIEGDITVPLNLKDLMMKDKIFHSIEFGKLQPFIENLYSGRATKTVSNLIYNMYLTSSYLSVLQQLLVLILWGIQIFRV